ncbi:protein RL1 [Cercopithecine betaherpesvirus 5]|uniref:Protein RL1 n=1 Tax=Simian cytomegalovirus (strain Colburn) TaxID=50292 RepID=G8XTP4_SCMVC|nr:protein RL1 [Cercopithecine betaherpesvirus 5]
MPHRTSRSRHKPVPWHQTVPRWRMCNIRLPGMQCPSCGDIRKAGDTYVGTCAIDEDDLTSYSGGSTSDEDAVNKYRRRLWNLTPTDSSDSSDSSEESDHTCARGNAERYKVPTSTCPFAHLQYLGAANTFLRSPRETPAPPESLPTQHASTLDAGQAPSVRPRTCPVPHLSRRKRSKLALCRQIRDPVGEQADDALRVRGYPVTRYQMHRGRPQWMSPDRGKRETPDCWCLWGEHAQKAARPLVPLLISRARDGPEKAGAWDQLHGRGFGYRAIPGPEGESRPVWTQHVVFLLGGHGARLQLNRPSAREAEARGLLPRWPMHPRTHSGSRYTRYNIQTTQLQNIPKVLMKHEILRAVPHTGTSRLAERGERGAWIVADTFTAPGNKLDNNTRPASMWWERDRSPEPVETTIARLRETARPPRAPRLRRRPFVIHTESSSSYSSGNDSPPTSDSNHGSNSDSDSHSDEESQHSRADSTSGDDSGDEQENPLQDATGGHLTNGAIELDNKEDDKHHTYSASI